MSAGGENDALRYQDFGQISAYAMPALQWACGEGIITGKENSALDPCGLATRAEVAAILTRFLKVTK